MDVITKTEHAVDAVDAEEAKLEATLKEATFKEAKDKSEKLGEREEENEKPERVTAWEVKGDVNSQLMYDRLIQQFGCEPITDDLKERFERVTKTKLHTWMRRNLFFAHRNLSQILDDYEKGIPIYLYTGRGPTSDSLHIGHVIAMQFCQWLQKVFNAFVIFQIADDEKYYFKENLSYEQICAYGRENCKDLAAMGYDPYRTFIFFNRAQTMMPSYQKVGADFKKSVSMKHISAIFGLDESASIGQFEWPIWQTVPAFSQSFNHFKESSKFKNLQEFSAAIKVQDFTSSNDLQENTTSNKVQELATSRRLQESAAANKVKENTTSNTSNEDKDKEKEKEKEKANKGKKNNKPNEPKESKGIRCLIVYAIDQDPYFRMARELAAKFDYYKPCSIMCRFLPALEGDAKMSSSVSVSTNSSNSSNSSNTTSEPIDNKVKELPPRPKTIFLTSSTKEIKTLIGGAFSGGADTLELHRKNGGNPDVDVPFQLMRYFLDDDAELEKFYNGYKDGSITSGEMKKRCTEVITAFVESHKKKRGLVTDETMKQFYSY